MKTLPQIRRRIRAERRTLSDAQQAQHAERLFELLMNEPNFRRAKRIAGFIASDGELDPAPVLEHASQRNKQVFLPVLNRLYGNRLWFSPYTQQTKLILNRYNIPEPPLFPPQPIPTWSLDLVLTPLVAFDAHGNRTGMGGGYYDRTFAFLKRKGVRNRPKLLGIAHSFQQVQSLDTQRWDVPLVGIATENSVHWFR